MRAQVSLEKLMLERNGTNGLNVLRVVNVFKQHGMFILKLLRLLRHLEGHLHTAGTLPVSAQKLRYSGELTSVS